MGVFLTKMKCLGKIIPKKEWDVGLLILLIQNRRLDDVKKLVCHGVDINTPAWTPLQEASLQGDADIAEILIAAGADMDFTDRCGSLPLAMAIDGMFSTDSYRYIRCAQILIANGARLFTILDYQLLRKASQSRLFDFEYGVLKCRSACIALLKSGKSFRIGGKYMVRELGIAI